VFIFLRFVTSAAAVAIDIRPSPATILIGDPLLPPPFFSSTRHSPGFVGCGTQDRSFERIGQRQIAIRGGKTRSNDKPDTRVMLAGLSLQVLEELGWKAGVRPTLLSPLGPTSPSTAERTEPT
jgi:hypothetical protein